MNVTFVSTSTYAVGVAGVTRAIGWEQAKLKNAKWFTRSEWNEMKCDVTVHHQWSIWIYKKVKNEKLFIKSIVNSDLIANLKFKIVKNKTIHAHICICIGMKKKTVVKIISLLQQ